jgi:hypothetical protein
MITLILLSTLASGCPAPTAWLDGDRSGPKARRAALRRADATCRKAGASREACAVLHVVAIRESSGDACAYHIRGPGEVGYGLHGLSWRHHAEKWYRPTDIEPTPEAFRIPEVSAVVALRIYRRAVRYYRATSWLQINSVFSGRIRNNRPYANADKDANFCARLARADIDCNADPREQLGKRYGVGPSREQAEVIP